MSKALLSRVLAAHIVGSLTAGTLLSSCDGGEPEASADPEPAKSAAAEAAKPADAVPVKAGEPTPKQDDQDEEATPPGDDDLADERQDGDDAPAEADETPDAADGSADDEAPAAEANEKEAPDKKTAGSKPKPKPEPQEDPTPKAKPKDDSDDASAAIDGKDLFMKKCKNCHGVDGGADTKIGKKHEIESWKTPGWTSKWTLAKVVKITREGKPDTKMKPFKDKLTPEEITAVAKYARRLGG